MPKRSWLAPPSPVESSNRPATSPGLRRSSDATDSSAQSFPLITAKQKHISDEQARWFLTLPEKIRRQQFSREEQITLMIRCKRALEFTSPEIASDAYRRCCSDPKRRARMSLTPQNRPSTSAGVSLDGTQSFLDIDAASVRTTETSNAEMKIFKLYSRRTASDVTDYEKTTNIDKPLPPPPEPVQLMPAPAPRPPKRSPFRRLSLTPLPLPPPILAPPIPSLPPISSISRRGSLRPASVTASFSARLSRPYMDMFSPADLPNAEPTSPSRPYHDVDIRKQLRRTLSSPEKFDEVLEFGFETDNNPTTCTPSVDFDFPFQHLPGPTSDVGDSDPMASYIDSHDEGDEAEEDEDDTTSVDTAPPRTPTPILIDLLPASTGKTPSLDSAIDMPFPLYQAPPTRPATSIADSVGNPREWTLHMTLTRPDLARPSDPFLSTSGVAAEAQMVGRQSAEDVLYSVQRQQTSGVEVETRDPLALQRLEVCEDNTGAQGAFAVGRDVMGSKGMKKAWRRMAGLGLV